MVDGEWLMADEETCLPHSPSAISHFPHSPILLDLCYDKGGFHPLACGARDEHQRPEKSN
jgi:hypothetical protein